MKGMNKLINALDSVIVAIQDFGRTEELKDGMIYYTAKSKLPESVLLKYGSWVRDQNKADTLVSLRDYIFRENQILSEMRDVLGISKKETSPRTSWSDQRKSRHILTKATQLSAERNPFRRVCLCCGENHRLMNCQKFQTMDIDGRWKVVKDKHLCFKCLGRNHTVKTCRSLVDKCAHQNCQKSHHPLLHDMRRPEKQSTMETSVSVKPTVESESSEVSMSTTSSGETSLRNIPVYVQNGGRRLKIIAVLDDCSTGCYLTEDVAAELGLQGNTFPLDVTVIGGDHHTIQSREVVFTVQGTECKDAHVVSAFTIRRITGDSNIVDWSKEKLKWDHLNSLHFPELPKMRRIDLLIGLSAPDLHCSIEERIGKKGEPIARLTPLGWCCIGSSSHSTQFTRNARVFLCINDRKLDTSLRKFWELESLGLMPIYEKVVHTPEEKRALEMTEASLYYNGVRYEVGIPWKTEEMSLPNNFDMALARLGNLERSLLRKPQCAEEYDQKLKKHESDGYICRLPFQELSQEGNAATYAADMNQWYIPHFPVVREDKSTTKVRIVFDCSAKYCGRSLNDEIYAGPKLHQEILDVLLRFRMFRVALVGDIQEMFLQIGLRKEDRKFHRFLWRNMNVEDPPQVYEFQRVVFGNRASPFLAQMVLQTHAKKNESEYPEATDTVLNAMIMDDVTDSRESTTRTIELRRQLTELFSKAGFLIRKWISNDPEVLNDIPEEERAPEISMDNGALNMPAKKILGVLWKSAQDSFGFEVNIPENVSVTKRIIISKIATIFDPLQILAPFTIRAKCLMQELWVRGLGWDDVIPEDLFKIWLAWISEMDDLRKFDMPRWMGMSASERISLHVFVDASSLAFAAVAYIRTVSYDGKVTVIFAAAKARVAPLRALSIPRLELLAAVTGARLACTIGKVTKIAKVNHTFWCDSLNVLHWLNGQSKHYKPFVAHRIGEIHELYSPEQWRYVPTELNVSDKATRGLSAQQLCRDCEWRYGPAFLEEDCRKWPERMIISSLNDGVERRTTAATVSISNSCPISINPEDYSSWKKLLKTTAWCLRFTYILKIRVSLRRCNQQTERSRCLCANCLRLSEALLQFGESLSLAEVEKARKLWIQHAQADCFLSEINSLKERRIISKSSRLISLNPFIDEDGLLRSNGRIKNAVGLTRYQREPIILPRKHPVTKLIISDCDENLHHFGGVNHVHAELRQTYWILRGREAVRSYKYKCPRCKILRARPSHQIMAPLPSSRMVVEPAFARCGVDFAGPFYTKQGRGKPRMKRYLCLFTCLVTRAVHLEMAWSLTTDAFLLALSRMTNRRGRPKEMVSDNGSNFVAAERELREMLADQEKILKKSSEEGILWKFNPPGAPHFGGVFETMVKSAKRAISAVLRNAEVTDEELLSTFAIAEGLVNGRPLTYQSSDAEDAPPLTPNHFIFGRLSGQLPPEHTSFDVKDMRRRWYVVQAIMNHFWTRWIREILSSLNPRRKWATARRNFNVGDIVIALDATLPRGRWPLGRIEEVCPGPDGYVRVVKVKINNKVYTRAASTIYLLERAKEDGTSPEEGKKME